MALNRHKARRAMNRRSINVLKAAGLVILGIGIGTSSTVLLQQWTSTSPPMPNSRAEQEPPPPAALITELLLTGEPFMGSGNAPLTIVEFSDFECPYCRQVHEEVLPSL